ncbi:MAG: DUF1467 family protein [Alphaproteobacteria bacterium]|nr:DUF1467 family protein [Alphaproteobacteria bacterium]
MKWYFDVALYVICWWLTLFVVLPWGVKPANEAEQGHDPGAPARPDLWKKALVTTLVAVVVWLILHWALVWELAHLGSGT